ncbi:hypothetical protein YEEN111655_12090 [Yersinia entomophaga]
MLSEEINEVMGNEGGTFPLNLPHYQPELAVKSGGVTRIFICTMI